MLRLWNPDRPTTLESDCLGFATGGILTQENEEGPTVRGSVPLAKAYAVRVEFTLWPMGIECW